MPPPPGAAAPRPPARERPSLAAEGPLAPWRRALPASRRSPPGNRTRGAFGARAPRGQKSERACAGAAASAVATRVPAPSAQRQG